MVGLPPLDTREDRRDPVEEAHPADPPTRTHPPTGPRPIDDPADSDAGVARAAPEPAGDRRGGLALRRGGAVAGYARARPTTDGSDRDGRSDAGRWRRRRAGDRPSGHPHRVPG